MTGCEAYVTPVGSDWWGRQSCGRGGDVPSNGPALPLPALEERLAGVAVASTDRGAGPLEQRCRRVTRGNLALVGDAGGYLDPITGEGLALAFHEAERSLRRSLMVVSTSTGQPTVAHRPLPVSRDPAPS